jgi:hypothetical protein
VRVVEGHPAVTRTDSRWVSGEDGQLS